MKPLYVLSRVWRKDVMFHVANVKGEGNPKSDWGYTTDSLKAKPVSAYWMRRFVADCRAVGAVAIVREVTQ